MGVKGLSKGVIKQVWRDGTLSGLAPGTRVGVDAAGWIHKAVMLPHRRRVCALSLLFVQRGSPALARASSQVAAQYEPLRTDRALFDPALVATEWLHPEFKALRDELANDDGATALQPLVHREHDEIYSFPLLKASACRRLFAEVEAFQKTGLPARRPNSMNNYGLILNDIGLRCSLDAVQAAVQPLARCLWPVEGASLDTHHSFCVSYKPSEDRGLDMHTDDSDVTLNVCLGSAHFDASGLTFCGDIGSGTHRLVSFQYKHQLGRAVMHLGRRRHGADDIRAGHRLNLIMWNYNQEYRASEAFRKRVYEREHTRPDAVCTSFTHDRDYEEVSGNERPDRKFSTTAWCPPPQAEYEGFLGSPGRYGHIDPMHRELPLN